MRRLPLVALTGLLAGSAALGLTSKPADAAFSISIGTPGYVPYNDWRYHHDRAYHDRYDRWRHYHDHHHR
jgi:hypothetical protein